jgi:hypothetical protein
MNMSGNKTRDRIQSLLQEAVCIGAPFCRFLPFCMVLSRV